MISALQFGTYSLPNILKVGGFDTPDFRISDYDLPIQDGGHYGRSFYADRKLTLEFYLASATTEGLLALRNAVFDAFDPKEGQKTLYITTMGTPAGMYQIDALPTRVEAPIEPQRPTFCHVHVELRAYNPLFLSQTATVQSTGITTITGGGVIPTAVGMTLAPNVNLNPNFLNPGNAYADVVWRISGPGTTFTVQNITTGKSFTLATTIADGSYIEVDTRNQTIKQGGFTDVSNIFTGDLMQLAAGTNVISFLTASGAGANTALRATFRGTYLGI